MNLSLKRNPLNDMDFLKQLDNFNVKNLHIKIVQLTFDEMPIKDITGRVVSGSLNIDGSSACRRTCNLSMISEEINLANVYWTLHTKFKLYIGLNNEVNSEYDDIIWFPQGIFVLTSYSSALAAQGYTLTIVGRDKMCLLDGTVSGMLPASIDVANIEVDNGDGTHTLEPIKIEEIINNLVHLYGNERLDNISINDIDEIAVELLNYQGISNMPLLVYQIDNNEYNMLWYNHESSSAVNMFAAWLLRHGEQPWAVAEKYSNGDTWYKLIKVVGVGDTVGYRSTDLTYPGNLTTAVGDTIVSVLDNIIKFLGEFEYFYDVGGHFMFQRKRIWCNTKFSTLVISDNNSKYYETTKAVGSAFSYEFDGNALVESFNNKPDITKIKNDYAIWGQNSKGYPIHLRYAIDKKPVYYDSVFNEKRYIAKDLDGAKLYEDFESYPFAHIGLNPNHSVILCDWREVIYQMAFDIESGPAKIEYLKDAIENVDKTLQIASSYAEEIKRIRQQELERIKIKDAIYAELKEHPVLTGYETYYADVLSFWRNQYDTFSDYTIAEIPKPEDTVWEVALTMENGTVEKHYVSGTSPARALVEVGYKKSPIGKITAKMTLLQGSWINGDYRYNVALEEKTLTSATVTYKVAVLDDTVAASRQKWIKNGFWNPDEFRYRQGENAIVQSDNVYFLDPAGIMFWLDFLDTDAAYQQFSVQAIGRRIFAKSDDKIKNLFLEDTPDILFVDTSQKILDTSSLSYVRLNLTNELNNYFRISTQGKSAKEELDGVLYEHTYYNESVTISSIPVYYLEPNTRIRAYDESSGIDSEYVIKSISIQLSHNGMMQIQATRAPERLL